MSEEDWKTVECQDTQAKELSTLRQKRLPFSPLCVVALEALERLETPAGAGAGQFLGGALLDLFHSQTEPSPLSLLVSRHQTVLTPDLVTQYLVSWTQQNLVGRCNLFGCLGPSLAELLEQALKAQQPLAELLEQALKAQQSEVPADDGGIKQLQQVLCLHVDNAFPAKQKMKKRRDSALETVQSTLWYQLRQLREDAELSADAEFLQGVSQSLMSAEEDEHLLHSQTLLLYIADAIARFDKTPKKCRHLLKTYFKLLTSLVQKVAASTAEELAGGEITPTVNSELLGLGDSLESPSPKLCSLDVLLGNLLKHPRLCPWFGGRGQGQPGALPSSSLQQKLGKLITDCMCGLLKSVHAVALSSSVLEMLKSHADALCSMVSQQLKDDSEDDGDLGNCAPLQALQSLLPFLDSASSMKVLDILLELPVRVLVNQDQSHSLSTAGVMVVQVASKCLSRASPRTEPAKDLGASESPTRQLQTAGVEDTSRKVSEVNSSLTADKVGRLLELLKTSSDAVLDEFCTELVQGSPHFARVCSVGVWRCLLERPSASRRFLLQQLLTNNSRCCKEFVAKATKDPNWLAKPEVINSGLIVTYLTLCKDSCDARILEVILGAFLKTAGKVAMETRESILEILTALVKLGQVGTAKASKLWNSLRAAASKGEALSTHHLQLMRALLEAGSGAAEAEQGMQAGQALVASCAQLQARLTSVHYSDDDPCVHHLLDLMLTALQTTSDEGSLGTLAKSWMSFLEAVLKHLYLVPSLHLALAKMVPLVYSGSCDPSCPIKSLQEMVMARKLFLPVLFGEHGPEVKDAVVSLLLSIVETSAACCDSAHIKVLLSAYSATLTLTDQKLLRMMYLYEEHGASFIKYKPLLWGARAMEHYSTGKTGLSLWLAPTFDHLMAAVDPDTMRKSALHFALRRSLVKCEVRPAEDYHSKADCYDPAFLLPFLTDMLEPGTKVDCEKLQESHCVAFLLSALSSHQPEVRGQAYTALSYLHQHLRDARGFRCRQELQQLLQLICASCQHPLQKLSCLTTTFLARAAALLPHPESHMYQVVKEYLELKPQLDLNDVPEFYKLFNSSSIQHKEEQMWMLSLLAEGVRETSDVSILNRRYVLKLLLSFYDSPVCDGAAKMQILRLVQSHCAIKATDELTLWLTSAISDMQQSAEKQKIAREILRLLEEKERRKGTVKKTPKCTKDAVEVLNGDVGNEPMECED